MHRLSSETEQPLIKADRGPKAEHFIGSEPVAMTMSMLRLIIEARELKHVKGLINT